MNTQLNTEFEDFNNYYIVCKQYSNKTYVYCYTGRYYRTKKFVLLNNIGYRSKPIIRLKDTIDNTVQMLNFNRRKCKFFSVKAENYFQETYDIVNNSIINKIVFRKTTKQNVLKEFEDVCNTKKNDIARRLTNDRKYLKENIKQQLKTLKDLKKLKEELDKFNCKEFVDKRYKDCKTQQIYDLLTVKDT